MMPPRPPGGEEGERRASALQGLVWGLGPPRALLSCAPGAKGRQADRIQFLWLGHLPEQ